MIKYIKSVLWRVAKCLSYIEEARRLKVNLYLTGMIRFLGPRVNDLKIPTRGPDSTSRERGQLVTINIGYLPIFLKSRRIVWLGHVMQMNEKRTPKRMLEWKPAGTRISGRPRKRWIVDTEENIQIMGIRR